MNLNGTLIQAGIVLSNPVATIPGQTLLMMTLLEETVVASRRAKAFTASFESG